MAIEQTVTYRYSRNGGTQPIRRTVGDALGALVLLLGERVRIHTHSPKLITLAETDFLGGQVSTLTFEGETMAMWPLFETVRRFLHAPAGVKQPSTESGIFLPFTPRHLVALALALGIDEEEMTAIAAMSCARIALLVRFHVDLGVPVGTLLTAMQADWKTVRALTGDDINKAALDAIVDLVRTERPGACPIALARELRAGVELDPRTFGWSA